MSRKINPSYHLFSERLKYAIGRKKIDQKRLAEDLSISPSIVSCYVNSKTMPETDKIFTLAEYLDVSPVWLLGAEVTIDGMPVMLDNDPKRLALARIVHADNLERIIIIYNILCAAKMIHDPLPPTGSRSRRKFRLA